MVRKGGDMRRRGESGQAFIMLLIILAIGTLLVVPAMNLTSTSLKSSEIVYDEVRSLYAADGAQEYVLWKLRWTDWGSTLARDVRNEFPVDV
jgi:Tfp pilus assembly protein PilX